MPTFRYLGKSSPLTVSPTFLARLSLSQPLSGSSAFGAVIADAVHEHQSEAPAAGITQDIRKWLDGAIRRIALTVVGTVYSGCCTRGRGRTERAKAASSLLMSLSPASVAARWHAARRQAYLGCSRGRQLTATSALRVRLDERPLQTNSGRPPLAAGATGSDRHAPLSPLRAGAQLDGRLQLAVVVHVLSRRE